MTAFGRWYSRRLESVVPAYSLLGLVFCFLWNILIYVVVGRVMAGATHYDLTTAFDRAVPFAPWWIYIYLGCYVFWGANYILAGREGREFCFRFVTGDVLSRTICGIIYIVLPTTNIRPEVTGSDLASMITRFVYWVDIPVNLFPSIHCLVSWMCFIGIRKSRKVPLWYKVFTVVFAILVMASTQLTKQHYIVDVLSGVALAEICFAIGMKTQWYKVTERVFERINAKVFGERYDDEKKDDT